MKEFVTFWADQPYEEYPGLLTLPVEPRFKEARPYVTNLIDAFWTYFYMTDHLLKIHRELGACLVRALPLPCSQCIAYFVCKWVRSQPRMAVQGHNMSLGPVQ